MTVNRPVLGLQWRAARWVAPAAVLLASLLAPAASALEVIDSNGGVIYVEVNKGRLLRLDEVPATVFLADPNIADLQFKSSKLVYIIGKATGETSLFALDRRERVLLNRKIVVGYDLDQLNASIEALIANSGVTASMVNNTLILDGVVGSPAEAEQVRELAKTFTGGGGMLNRLSVSMPNQINLRVKFAEVNRNVSKEFSFDHSISGGAIQFGTFLGEGLASGTVFADFHNIPIGDINLDTWVTALETEGLVTILAEPNLTTVSGETASFLAGGEVPFGTTDANGNATIVFKPFGISLSFTPTLLDRDRISINVRPEVSQVGGPAGSIGGISVRGLTTRRAETTVELGDGQSLVLAGLLQRNINETISKVPGLGDIPILGALFRSENFINEETELMIIVTPYIVRPTSERIAMPTDGFQPPNDYERILWGGMYRQSDGGAPDRVATSGGKQLVGSIGFKVE
ncbi:MAG: type II and III secretion system protein family protein [Gammaproteobacteria bacterium]|nr:type II and III secretion system protein family protein [Gammaproteobacteria bacterium]